MKNKFTQQEAFALLISPDFQRQPTVVSEKKQDTFCLFNYLAAASIKYLRPTWLKNNKHSQAFDIMVAAFNQYRSKTGEDSTYEQLGKDYGIGSEAVLRRDRDHPLGVYNLGLVLSKNPKDVRFVSNTFKTYFLACFTSELETAEKWLLKQRRKERSRLRNFVTRNNSPRSAVLSPAAVSVADTPPVQMNSSMFMESQGVLGPRQSGTENCLAPAAAEMKEMFDLLYIYASLLLDENLFIPRQEVFAEESVRVWEKGNIYAQAAKLRDIAPSLETCLDLSHKFQPFLLQAYLARAMDIDIAVLGEEENPTCQLLKSMQKHGLEEFRQSFLKERELRMGAQNRERALEGRVSVLERDLKSAEARKLEDGMTAIDRDELSALLAGAKTTSVELERTKEEMERLQRELRRAEQAKEKLETELSRLNNAYNDLNEQFIESFEEDGLFVEEDEEEDVRGSGLRGRLGDEAIRKLAAKRMIIVGGHENTHATLKELFPDWEYYPQGRPVGKGAWAGDAIVCITCYMSHKSFISAKALAKSKGIRMIMISYNSPISICKQLLTHLN